MAMLDMDAPTAAHTGWQEAASTRSSGTESISENLSIKQFSLYVVMCRLSSCAYTCYFILMSRKWVPSFGSTSPFISGGVHPSLFSSPLSGTLCYCHRSKELNCPFIVVFSSLEFRFYPSKNKVTSVILIKPFVAVAGDMCQFFWWKISLTLVQFRTKVLIWHIHVLKNALIRKKCYLSAGLSIELRAEKNDLDTSHLAPHLLSSPVSLNAWHRYTSVAAWLADWLPGWVMGCNLALSGPLTLKCLLACLLPWIICVPLIYPTHVPLFYAPLWSCCAAVTLVHQHTRQPDRSLCFVIFSVTINTTVLWLPWPPLAPSPPPG